MRVLAIDPGPRNLGLAVLERSAPQSEVRVLRLENHHIFNTDKIEFERVYPLTLAWCHALNEEFLMADAVVVEKQHIAGEGLMPHVLNTMVTVIRMYAGTKHELVPPRSVRKWFGLPVTGEHRKNKALSVSFVNEHYAAVLAAHSPALPPGSKVDDAVDALLLALFKLGEGRTQGK